MRTLIVSDLHLGSVSRADLLRRRALRAPLLEAAADVDRVVLLGDVLELRHGPPREALAAARPFFEDLGRALKDGELIITAGNHDHAMIEPWLARRGGEEDPAPLGVEQLLAPTTVSPILARIGEWASPARLLAAYPGLWVREDVYAMHGHYLDCHLTVPTLERLSMGFMCRVLRRPAEEFHTVEDYEAVGAPVYAWSDAVAREARTGGALNGKAMVTAWRALNGDRAGGGASNAGLGGPLAAHLRRRALAAGFPLAVAALNRAGFGPLRAELSPGELRRAGLKAMAEVALRLGLGDAYVVFGHTHRAGPLPGDRREEWLGRTGARLVNAGCWTYAPIFLGSTAGKSPYWPGACVLVEDSGPPVIRRLLQDRTRAELRPPPAEPKPAPA